LCHRTFFMIFLQRVLITKLSCSAMHQSYLQELRIVGKGRNAQIKFDHVSLETEVADPA
jgi:hypothetical protein